MRVRTQVGQVALVRGGQHEQPQGILVDEPSSRFGKGRSRGNLYVLVDVSGPDAGRDIVAGQLAQTMRRAYYKWQGSVTAGLQEAVREANNLLFDDNRNSLPGERRTAGVSCVVLRDTDLFVAQAGPAAVYVVGEKGETRYPNVSPWLDGIPPEEMDAAALGDRRDVNVTLFHHQVGRGDTLLLADGELARRVPLPRWRSILANTPVEGVLGQLLAMGKGGDLSALVVRLAEQGIERVPVGPVASGDVQEQPPAPGQPVGEQLSRWAEQLRVGERLGRVGRALTTMLAGLWTVLLTLAKRMMPGQLGPPQAGGRQTTSVRKAAKRTTERTRRAKEPAHSDRVQRVLVGVAIALPLVVAVIVLVTFIQRGESRKAQVAALLEQATGHWQQAQAATDSGIERGHLTTAVDLLDQVLEHRSEQPEALALRSEIQARLDAVNRIVRITSMEELATYPADADLTRVVVQGAHVFVMDRHDDKVYHHRLDEQRQNALQSDSLDSVLVAKRQQVGDVLVGDLMDMVWMPTGPNRQRASLVILESGGGLLDYDPATGELLALHVAASETWQFPRLVGSHTGRFYLLDTSASKIWRYNPTPDDYSAAPDEWLQSELDLAGVVDMAVGDSIFLLYADGTIQKLTVGEPDAFDIADWDSPPRSPSAIYTRPPDATHWVYVADRGNSRIVQCSKEGRFERQFRLDDSLSAENRDPLASATSLFMDEISGRAYLLSGQKLYLLVLPMPG
jgi:hypothetical protein